MNDQKQEVSQLHTTRLQSSRVNFADGSRHLCGFHTLKWAEFTVFSGVFSLDFTPQKS